MPVSTANVELTREAEQLRDRLQKEKTTQRSTHKLRRVMKVIKQIEEPDDV